MTDRLLTLTVTGFTPAGFEISMQLLDVKAADLETAITWFDNTMSGRGIRPVAGRETTKGAPVMNENGGKRCKIHNVDMEQHEKGTSHWFSHKVTGADGAETWCRGK
jgi:hypothetical protein